MPSTPLQAISTPGIYLGEAWRLHKAVCGQLREARCELWSHERGWQIFLIVDGGELRRSEVCADSDALLATSDSWKSAMVDRSWC